MADLFKKALGAASYLGSGASNLGVIGDEEAEKITKASVTKICAMLETEANGMGEKIVQFIKNDIISSPDKMNNFVTAIGNAIADKIKSGDDIAMNAITPIVDAVTGRQDTQSMPSKTEPITPEPFIERPEPSKTDLLTDTSEPSKTDLLTDTSEPSKSQLSPETNNHNDLLSTTIDNGKETTDAGIVNASETLTKGLVQSGVGEVLNPLVNVGSSESKPGTNLDVSAVETAATNGLTTSMNNTESKPEGQKGGSEYSFTPELKLYRKPISKTRNNHISKKHKKRFSIKNKKRNSKKQKSRRHRTTKILRK